jgi:tRNA(adenine34) deaminase
MQDSEFMMIALEEARLALEENEVPIGAVLEYEGRIVARNHNRMVQQKSGLAHAELLVLQSASANHPDPWLLNTTLYVTIEPCAMCAGAIVLARVKRLVFAAPDPKAGACGSTLNIPASPFVNHHPIVESGILYEESTDLLRGFFQRLRSSAKGI